MSTPERGDYVTYTRYFDDGIGTGMEQGAGYLERVDGESAFIRNGEREIRTPMSLVEIRAKQYRLPV